MSGSTTFAPIVLFVYNRVTHTARTVEALQKNELAQKSDLIIFSDAPKLETHVKKVTEVRNYIRQIKGFRSVTIIEREENFGLAHSIINGVTSVINQYGRLIVMEDDLVTSPNFLRYMNDSLALYEEDEKVMHISGSAYPIKPFKCSTNTYFLRLPLCWGWGTWKRAWNTFEKNLTIMSKFDSAMISSFNFDNSYNYWRQLELNQSGQMSTWFIFWYAHIFLQNGLSLFPIEAMVKNIGHDGSGIHCDKNNQYDVSLSDRLIKPEKLSLEVSQDAFDAHKRFFSGISPTLTTRFLSKLRRVMAPVFKAIARDSN